MVDKTRNIMCSGTRDDETPPLTVHDARGRPVLGAELAGVPDGGSAASGLAAVTVGAAAAAAGPAGGLSHAWMAQEG